MAYKIRPTEFSVWFRAQRERDDHVGELAREVFSDLEILRKRQRFSLEKLILRLFWVGSLSRHEGALKQAAHEWFNNMRREMREEGRG